MSIKGTNILAENEELKIHTEVFTDGKKSSTSDFMLYALRSMGVENTIEFRNALGNKVHPD
jgi:hypothetical protein